MLIPTITPADMNESTLNELMQIGFCYIALPDKSLIAKIQRCVKQARQFFREPTSHKEQWQLQPVLKPGDRYQGYALRSQSRNANGIEQIFFEPDAPYGPYEDYADDIKAINDCYMNHIFLPVINAIFSRLKISSSNLKEVIRAPYRSLVFQSCPTISEGKDSIRFNAHKDFGLLTIVYFEEPGLEVFYQNEWIAIAPKDGCVVLNIGNAIELMTGKQCHSALHRVTNMTDDRTSMVYFISPNYKQVVRNYVDNSVIAETGEMFFKQQFVEYYATEL